MCTKSPCPTVWRLASVIVSHERAVQPSMHGAGAVGQRLSAWVFFVITELALSEDTTEGVHR